MKKLFFLILISSISLSTYAQSISPFFTSMPNELLSSLTPAMRMELVKRASQKEPSIVSNLVNGKSELKEITDDYLFLQLSERSSLELKLFSLVNNSRVICMVKTFCGPLCESELSFYTSDWKLLDKADFIDTPKVDWFLKQDIERTDDANYLISKLDFNLFQYKLSKDSETLTVLYNSPQNLSIEDKKDIQKLIKEEPVVFKWEKTGFKK